MTTGDPLIIYTLHSILTHMHNRLNSLKRKRGLWPRRKSNWSYDLEYTNKK
jgi:hypothetical protein